MNPLAALPVWLVALLVPFTMLCIGVLIWSILPRRTATARRDARIDRQIATLRRHADHSTATRPRVRSNGCKVPPPTWLKAPPPPIATPKPRACGGGMCRHRADCADHHCPGRMALTTDPATRPTTP